MSEYIHCDCGSIIKKTPSNVSIHKRSNRHLRYLEEKVVYARSEGPKKYVYPKNPDKKREYNRKHYLKRKLLSNKDNDE
jgi:hypothetical protein